MVRSSEKGSSRGRSGSGGRPFYISLEWREGETFEDHAGRGGMDPGAPSARPRARNSTLVTRSLSTPRRTSVIITEYQSSKDGGRERMLDKGGFPFRRPPLVRADEEQGDGSDFPHRRSRSRREYATA
jgi:hypothetical protein